jgi:predicted RNA binding protein YcfA (HicA-like mRNA interferase family)
MASSLPDNSLAPVSSALSLPFFSSPLGENHFETLKNKVCSVMWKIGNDHREETTGCFIKTNEADDSLKVLSCFHKDSWGKASIHIKLAGSNELIIAKISFYSQSCDMSILEIESPEKRATIEATHGFFQEDANDNPASLCSLGNRVCFAGFPLSKSQPIIHKGRISSVNGQEAFTIDGTIVMGYSGGPVTVQHNERLILIGVISSQVVHITKSLMEILNKRKYFVAGPSTLKLWGEPLTVIIKDIVRNFLNNTSTGIGEANIVFGSSLEKVEIQEVSSLASFPDTSTPLMKSCTQEDWTAALSDVVKELSSDECLSSLPTGKTPGEVVKEARAEGYLYNGKVGSHITFTHPEKNKISVPIKNYKGGIMATGTEKSILKTIHADPDNQSEHPKGAKPTTLALEASPPTSRQKMVQKNELVKIFESLGYKLLEKLTNNGKEIWSLVSNPNVCIYVSPENPIPENKFKSMIKEAQDKAQVNDDNDLFGVSDE